MPGDDDCAVLCDADLAMLAAEPQRYKAYLTALRAEYAHIPVEEFVRARIAILRRLQERPRLFASPLGHGWEEPARQNVDAELQRLEREFGTLEAAHVLGQSTEDDAAGADTRESGSPADAGA
jgi:predicted metal-dependent HD superfamily phosphohydrolase